MNPMRLLPVCALAFLSACSRGDGAAEAAPPLLTDKFASDHFLQFFNKQASLGAGDYRLVVAPAAAGTGTYSIVATQDDGTSQAFSGSWSSLASADPADPDDPAHAITLTRAGGLAATLDGSGAACLYLVDLAGNLVARAGDADAATAACDTGAMAAAIALPHSKTNDASYARAYYATIDPADDRDTLDKWKQANGFGTPNDVHVIFRDTRDLGYGRDMHFHDGADEAAPRTHQYAFYVNNYAVTDVPGESYGPLNLQAAIEGVREYHIGTNAIEYGPLDFDGDGNADDVNYDGVVNEQDYFPRFYNFSPDPPYERRLAVNLDGKGDKAMPGPCIVCHGGRADALVPAPFNPANADSRFPRGGDTLAHLQPLDVGSFAYWDRAPWTRAEMEPKLKLINQAVYDSYAVNDAAIYDAVADPNFAYGYAEWDSTLARQMLESWYGGAGLPGTFSDTYVPDGWNPAVSQVPAVPLGADLLYHDVIRTSCRTCHLLRGIDYQSDIDFTAFDKFLGATNGYGARVEDLVFDRGVMPLATLTFREFHETTALATELSNFIPGFSHVDGNGDLLLPGRPVARAGPDFRSPIPAGVSGAASLFARTYQWSITSTPSGAVASLDDPQSVRPRLTADTDGPYVLTLVVGDGTTTSAPDTVTVTLDSTMTPLTFTADIKPLLSSLGCTGCHYPGGGPPVFYADPLGTDPPASQNRDVYQTFRSLVNLEDPEYSRMLLKPTGNHHGGGQVITAGDANYQTLLNWVLEGAPE